MKYLLNVNVLVAWGWLDHVDHVRTVKWIAGVAEMASAGLFTASIPELGFVRVSVQRTGGRVTVAEASRTLAAMLKTLGARHAFLPDDQPAADFPAWCQSASRTTDAHLMQLAERHRLKLASLDAAIPGAFVIPSV